MLVFNNLSLHSVGDNWSPPPPLPETPSAKFDPRSVVLENQEKSRLLEIFFEILKDILELPQNII